MLVEYVTYTTRTMSLRRPSRVPHAASPVASAASAGSVGSLHGPAIGVRPGRALPAAPRRKGERRTAAIGGCVAVNTTIYCFTTEEVTSWWILLSQVVPSAPRETELDRWLRGEKVDPAAIKAVAAFYQEHLQDPLGLAAPEPQAFENYENGMALFREALTELYKQAIEDKLVTAASSAPLTPPVEKSQGGG